MEKNEIDYTVQPVFKLTVNIPASLDPFGKEIPAYKLSFQVGHDIKIPKTEVTGPNGEKTHQMAEIVRILPVGPWVQVWVKAHLNKMTQCLYQFTTAYKMQLDMEVIIL